MTRTTRATITSAALLVESDLEIIDDLEEDAEVILLKKSEHNTVNVLQYIVYASSFQVPAFYFIIYDSSKWPQCTYGRVV